MSRGGRVAAGGMILYELMEVTVNGRMEELITLELPLVQLTRTSSLSR